MKILLFGAYGRKNLGDDIYLKIFLEKFVNQTVYFNCWDTKNLPEDVHVGPNHFVFRTSMTRDLRVKIKAFFTSDIVIYGGGELWMVFDGYFVKNASLYKMLITNLLLKIIGKKIYYLSCGAEPLAGWSLILARLSAKLAHHIYLRDEESAAILNLKKEKYTVLPDLVFLLETPTKTKYSGRIGINVLYNITHSKKNLSNYISDTAESINFIGLEACGLPAMSDTSYKYNDVYMLRQLEKNIQTSFSLHKYVTIQGFIEEIINTDLVISSRLHVGLVALIARVPVIGISYKSKVRKFYKSINLGHYCFPVRGFKEAVFNVDISKLNLKQQEAFNVITAKKHEAKVGYGEFFKCIKKLGNE